VDQAFVSLASFTTTVIVGRFAGVTALGEYSLAFTIVLLLMMVQDCLIASPYSVLCHQLGRSAQRRFSGNLLLIGGIFTLIAAFSLLAAGQIAREMEGLERFDVVFRMLAVAVPAALIRELVRRMALAHLDVRAALAIDVAASMCQVGTLIAMAMMVSVTSHGALLAIAVGGSAGFGVAVLMAGREWRIARRRLLRDLGAAVRFGKWLCAARLTSVLHDYAVPWLLGMMIGLEAVGGFSAAFGLTAVGNPMLIGVLNTMAPQAARAWAKEGAHGLRQAVRQRAILLTSITVLLAAPVAIFAGEILGLVYGSEYIAYGSVGTVLTISVVASVVGTPADFGLRALQRPAGSFVASACGLTVTVLGTLMLVPLLGVIGGACALTLGSATSSAGEWHAFRRLLRMESDPTMDNPQPNASRRARRAKQC
jgi:O-antigen/teichoic acid export membrane protein